MPLALLLGGPSNILNRGPPDITLRHWLGVTDLTEFGLYLKVDKAKIEGQTKVKIIKVIRTELEKIINTLDSDVQTNEYLKGLIDFLDQNAQPKPSDEEGNTLKPSQF